MGVKIDYHHIGLSTLIVQFVHFMAKHYRHQDTKAQKWTINQRCHFVPLWQLFRRVWIMITPEPNDFASKKKRPPGIFRIAVKEENR
jgi:hypothetical protein